MLERLARDAGVWPAPRLTRDALVHLQRYPFPGNVRELENLLHRAVALSGGEVIDVYDLGLPETVFTDSAAQELDLITENTGGDADARPRAELARRWLPVEEPLPNDLAEYLDEVERDILVRALEQHRFNRTAAGISLGLSLRQMRYRMARLGVNVGGDADRCRARVSAADGEADDAGTGWLARALRAAARRRTSARGRRAQPSTWSLVHSISLPPGEYGGDAIERLFTNRLDWDAHPYYARDSRDRGVGALPGPARRRAAAVRVVRRARLARRRIGVARARALQRFLDRHRARRPRGFDLRSGPVRGARGAAAGDRRALPDRAPSPATSTSRRAASATPGPGFDWRAAWRRCGWPGRRAIRVSRRLGARD